MQTKPTAPARPVFPNIEGEFVDRLAAQAAQLDKAPQPAPSPIAAQAGKSWRQLPVW